MQLADMTIKHDNLTAISYPENANQHSWKLSVTSLKDLETSVDKVCSSVN